MDPELKKRALEAWRDEIDTEIAELNAKDGALQFRYAKTRVKSDLFDYLGHHPGKDYKDMLASEVGRVREEYEKADAEPCLSKEESRRLGYLEFLRNEIETKLKNL